MTCNMTLLAAASQGGLLLRVRFCCVLLTSLTSRGLQGRLLSSVGATHAHSWQQRPTSGGPTTRTSPTAPLSTWSPVPICQAGNCHAYVMESPFQRMSAQPAHAGAVVAATAVVKARISHFRKGEASSDGDTLTGALHGCTTCPPQSHPKRSVWRVGDALRCWSCARG